ncbi:MAG: hypothetical protein ACKOQ4_07310, partial [Mycobacterium sp.]
PHQCGHHNGPRRGEMLCHGPELRPQAAVPRSPTTTGKIERLHRSMRAEFRAVAKHFTSAGPVVMSTLMGIYCGSL